MAATWTTRVCLLFSPLEEAGALLDKSYGVDTNNGPPNGINTTQGDALSDIAQDGDLPDSGGTPQEPGIQESEATDREDILIAWLKKRIGRNRFIYATGSAEYSKKYLSKPTDYQPDFRAYLAGNKNAYFRVLSHAFGQNNLCACV